MASSFSSQIPAIIDLVQRMNPQSVLDIGKGFGKYGFLIHEYIGIDSKKRLNPKMSMAEQSRIKVDAIEVDESLLLPHLSNIYQNIFIGDVFDLYQKLDAYDLILMIDVIEHLDKEKALQMLKFYLSKNSTIIVATPIDFFEQHLYESSFEDHISHWTIKDFQKLGHVDCQFFSAGAVYLLSNEKKNIRGFGSAFVKKLRRVARAIKNEFG